MRGPPACPFAAEHQPAGRRQCACTSSILKSADARAISAACCMTSLAARSIDLQLHTQQRYYQKGDVVLHWNAPAMRHSAPIYPCRGLADSHWGESIPFKCHGHWQGTKPVQIPLYFFARNDDIYSCMAHSGCHPLFVTKVHVGRRVMA